MRRIKKSRNQKKQSRKYKRKRLGKILILISIGITLAAILFAVRECSSPNVYNLIDSYGQYTSYHISENKKSIYISGQETSGSTSWHKLKGVNAKRFVALSHFYGKDDEQVFYRGEVVTGYHTKKGIVNGIDVLSFFVDENGFPRDRNRVYAKYSPHSLEEIEDANPGTFEPLRDDQFTRDDTHYFYYATRLDIADYDSFVCYSGSPAYGKDKHHVYMISKSGEVQLSVIPNVNPETFEVIHIDDNGTDTNWARDDKHYFYRGEQSDIDYESFRVLYSGAVIDKNHVYRYGKIIDKKVEDAIIESEKQAMKENLGVKQ